MQNVKNFLDEKPLFYKEIDYARMPKAYNLIADKLSLVPVIHIVGTNGKGSTGRFLAHTLLKKGFSVGHYTSPHILKFNERIWINGSEISDEFLQEVHENVYKLLGKKVSESLSYFEYTTLLAAFAFEGLDFVIMEAGLGGEYDATAVFPQKTSLITTIDYDHQAFLGNSIKDIAKTKLNSIKKEAIIGRQINKVGDISIFEYAKMLKPDLPVFHYLDFFDAKEIEDLRKDFTFTSFLFDNYLLAVSFLKKEGIDFSIEDIEDLKLKGRFEEIQKDLWIDVGHNPLAAKSIVKVLPKKINLVYNTYADKDYEEILKILKPKINKLCLIDVENPRIEKKENIKKVAKKLGIDIEDFNEIVKPMLVFGSFSVVEEFIKKQKIKMKN
ncbi:bifunctional folylpolyglutamate synthase/dihydrofolate synthase [Caminibacter sp.]